jgi:hypothetical protein
MSQRQAHLIGLVGVVAGALFLAAFLLDPTPPTAGATAADVLEHGRSFATQDRIAAFLFAGSGSLLIVFLTGLRQLVHAVSRSPRWLATAMLAGGVETATLLTSASLLFFTLASRAGVSGPAEASLFVDMTNYAFVFAGFGAAVVVLMGSLAMLGTSGALNALGRLGLLVAVLQIPYLATGFFTSGTFVAGGLVSIICFSAVGLWIALSSIALLVLERHALAGSAAAADIGPVTRRH